MKLFAARLARAAVMGVLAAGVVLAVAHVPAVRSRVVAWGLERLRSSCLIDVKVEQASYNLLTLSGRLRGVTASALDGAGVPFVRRVAFCFLFASARRWRLEQVLL